MPAPVSAAATTSWTNNYYTGTPLQRAYPMGGGGGGGAAGGGEGKKKLSSKSSFRILTWGGKDVSSALSSGWVALGRPTETETGINSMRTSYFLHSSGAV